MFNGHLRFLIGEALGRRAPEWKPPFYGPADTRFKEYIEPRWRERFIVINLLDYSQQPDKKGSKFDVKEARAAGSAIARMAAAMCAEPEFFICGWRAARAMRQYGTKNYFHCGHVNVEARRAAWVWVVPHPSGVNHWWNLRGNRRDFHAFFKKRLGPLA